MCSDPDTALARQHQREAAARRRRDRQIEDLIASARVLLPEHGLALALGAIAVHAGLTRHAARALFNATTDLATELVRRAWLDLIERLVPPQGATPEHVLACLIEAIRADAPAHVIHRTLACGAAAWQRDILVHAESLLALVVTEALRGAGCALPPDAQHRHGHRVLALAREAALSPHAADSPAEAARITALLAPLADHPAAGQAAAAAAAAPAATATPDPRRQASPLRRHCPPTHRRSPAAPSALPAHRPPARGPDPPPAS